MLNLEKLNIYKSFRGDIDSFGRSTNKKTREKINENDFRVIDEIVQGMILIKNNLSSDAYKKDIEDKTRESFGENYSDCQKLLDDIVNMTIG
ncbi:MAG TPA: hypothetical protein VNS58_18760 [Puia sp.]|nr:hypothetical protein [Puia sp.]